VLKLDHDPPPKATLARRIRPLRFSLGTQGIDSGSLSAIADQEFAELEDLVGERVRGWITKQSSD
jgi:hypothetical protein